MNIEKNLQEFTEVFLPAGFKWRIGQKEAVLTIVETYYAKEKNVVILDAPVGSGKSIIAMAVSWLLNQDNKKGYILASDIALQEQYEKDFSSFNLKWGSVKGLANYTCIDNMEKHSMGTCRIRGINPRKMSCYAECDYYNARDDASKSPTSLMNYAYWMVMQNYVNPFAQVPLFPPRDFTICDEGHKIVDIIQSQYSPKITPKTIGMIEKLTDFFDLHHVDDHHQSLIRIKSAIEKLENEENQDKLLDLLAVIAEGLRHYLPSITIFKKKIKEDYPNHPPPKEWRSIIRNADWLTDLYTKVADFVRIIRKTSTRNLVKNPQMKGEIVFNCLEESYMMHSYFHKWTGFTVIMSATFSDPKEYLKQIAIGNAKYIKLESSFQFEKSPIYYYNQRRMSYKHIDTNLPWLNDTIGNIIDEHKGKNGIIHTASYNLTMKIYENLSPEHRKRVLIYEGTEQKRMVLEQLKLYKDKILMGPSLLEGLDLKHDWSRFQIFAKVPYLSLADKFVKAKLDMNPGWYRWKAILNILQGIGRSIRSEDDWAITYILDASLSDLIRQHPKAFPSEFMKRIRVRKE